MSDVMHHSAHKWSARTYRIRQVAKQGTRARSGPQLSMFLQLAVILDPRQGVLTSRADMVVI